MYCNLFDTVRKDTFDYVQAEGALFHMILSGYHPTLSLNQAVDSNVISVLTEKETAFRECFDRGLIRVSLFGSHKSTLDYLSTHLAGINGKARNPFIFSSLPFLYTGEYSDGAIQEIYDAMFSVLQGNASKITSDILAPDHCEILNRYLFANLDLADRLNGKYLTPGKKSSDPLGKRLENFISQVQRQRPDIPISPEVLELQDKICRFRRENGLDPSGALDSKCLQLDSRSFFYGEIADITRGNQKRGAEATKIVDLCYNERVASSIEDGEEDLMISEPIYASLDHYACHDSMDNQSHTIAPVDATSPYATRFVTWDALKVVFDMVEAERPTAENRREVIARCCEKAGLPRFEPGHGIAEQQIQFSSTVLMAHSEIDSSDDAHYSARKYKDWSMDVTRRREHRNTRSDTNTNTGSLKSDYAKEDT